MTTHLPLRTVVTALILATLAGCSTQKIADNTTDVVVWTGKALVRGAVGAGKVVYRGAAAGVRALQEDEAGYPAGTLVCINGAGEIYAAAEESEDSFTCPPPDAV